MTEELNLTCVDTDLLEFARDLAKKTSIEEYRDFLTGAIYTSLLVADLLSEKYNKDLAEQLASSIPDYLREGGQGNSVYQVDINVSPN